MIQGDYLFGIRSVEGSLYEYQKRRPYYWSPFDFESIEQLPITRNSTNKINFSL